MKIDRTNYEIFFIDYADGKLNAKEINQLKTFLNSNADLQEEFDMFCNNEPMLETENIEFEGKNGLKKIFIPKNAPISTNNFSDFVIAEMENELSMNESFQLHQFILDNPQYEKEYELIHFTKLKPEYDIVFEHKNKLKKRTKYKGIIRSISYTTAMAASIALMVTIFNKANDYDNTTFGKLSAQVKENTFIQNNVTVDNSTKEIKNTTANNNKNTTTYVANESKNEPVIENTKVEKINAIDYKVEVENPKQINTAKPIIVADIFDYKDFNEQNEILAENNQEPRKDLVSIKNWMITAFKKNVLGKNVSHDENLNAWDVANVGLSEISKVINKDYTFEPKYADNGRLKTLGIKNNKK